MYLSGLLEFFFPKTSFCLSVPSLVKKRKYVHERVSQCGQHLFPGMAKEKDMLARKHRGSWQALTPQSNEEMLSINSWLLATLTQQKGKTRR